MAKTNHSFPPAWTARLRHYDQEKRMKVYIIMGNDYPDAVFRRKDEAEAYVIMKKKDEEERQQLGHRMIYWRVYDFELKE
jgi:hypothetical protein